MKNLKVKSLLIVLFTLTMLLVLGMGSVFASARTVYVPVYMSVTDENGTELNSEDMYTHIRPGDKISITAYCNHEKSLYWSQNSFFMDKYGYKKNDEGMALLSYYFDTNESAMIDTEDPTEAEITIPNLEPGVEHILSIEGVGAVDNWTDEEKNIYYLAKTGWLNIHFTIPVAEETITHTITRDTDTSLKLNATVENGTFSKFIYYWDNDTTKKQESINNPTNVTIPSFAPGSTHILTSWAYTATNISDMKTHSITMPESITGNISVIYQGTTLKNGSTTTVPAGSKITINCTPAENFSVVAATGKWSINNGATAGIAITAGTTLDIPGVDGQTITLTIAGNLKDGKTTATQNYVFKIGTEIEEPEPEELTGNVSVKLDGNILSNNSTNIVTGIESLTLTGSPVENFSSLKYRWDDGEQYTIVGHTGMIDVIAEKGETHVLEVYGILKDNTKTTPRVFKFVIEEETEENEQEDDELIIEPWMREDKDADGLLVSLRNDSEIEKANKNFYQLDEEIIYYVDYKNCGKDIDDEVKLVLNLPLKFKVVNSDGGRVSTSKQTVTWTFADGLEEEQSGTKEIVVKYKELSKSSYEYELVYPQAVIYKEDKKMDSSAVINYIYENESTEIDEEHEPYMFGDKEKPTFRPNDTISRAEGALVLTRIFGINITGTKVTNKYSDIKETYLEAQKAITAASDLGIINGYEDRTYRPNEKMTRAEFMKIIASYVEIIGEEEDIEGLEVKDGETIKIYKNPMNRNHWSIPYVTLLTRLNMTSASSSEKDLRLEDEITRAEVAQLVNFYSFRAPAKVTYSTKIPFIDVSRNHDLIEDIIEATREEHTFVITEDGKEKAK